MIRSSPVLAFPQAFLTASQISTANSGSVCVKVSGLYSNLNRVPYFRVHSSVSSLTRKACLAASSTVCSFELRKTMSRNVGEVALYI